MKILLKVITPLTVWIQTFTALELGADELIPKGNRLMTSMTTAYNVCDLDLIYGPAYAYSLPRGVLESFLSGKAFDNKDLYSEQEASDLSEDINQLFHQILSFSPVKEHLAVITAGAPGAGKTTKLCQDLEEKRSQGRSYAYICPDDVCLKSQTRTYLNDIEGGDGSREARQAAYNKWRPASNAATHLILGNLIREKYGFYFGTTSSGPATGKFFEFLKIQGYQIRLLHVTAPDDVRWGSIQERDKTFVQTTEEDVKEKGLLLPQRIMDTFLKYADQIEFYYRDGIKEDAQLSATWTRNREPKEALGTLHLHDSSRYEKIKAIHNAAVDNLQRPELLWESTVEKHSIVVQ